MQRTIVITERAADIPLILFDEVEAVLWQRRLPSLISKAVESFDPKSLDQAEQSIRRGPEPDFGQVYLNERDEKFRHCLGAIWNDRNRVSRALAKNLRARAVRHELVIQKPFNKESLDCQFHRDYTFGQWRGLVLSQTQIVFMTVAHIGFGTEVIPSNGAGRPTPDRQSYRSMFYHPTSVHPVSAQAGDVMVMKGGIKGSTHRAPHKVSKGLRFFTFYRSGRVEQMRLAFTNDELRNLQARIPRLSVA